MLRLFDIGQRAWPGLALSSENFTAFLQVHAVDAGTTTEDVVRDLFLACACAHQVPGALKSFREHYAPVASLAARRFNDSPAFAEEVFQRLSEALFVDGIDHEAKISKYSGAGSMAGFVGTAARRIALRLAAQETRFAGEEALVQQFSQIHEQETALFRMQHRETFNRALAIALRQLPTRERLVLRMNLVERVSTTKIAAMYKVSQPTVSRWIQKSAQTIFATVKDLVCDELAVDTRELQSILLLVRSQIEITLSNASASVTLPSD